MTDRRDDDRGAAERRGELIAAALASDLSPTERTEFDGLRAADPSIDAELAELGGVVEGLDTVGVWADVSPSDDLRRRIEGIGRDTGAGVRGPRLAERVVGPHVAAARSGRGRVPLLIAVGAAACLAIGVGAGALLAMPRDQVVAGAAGTLGALEHVDFAGQPDGVEVDGDLVAHTWGTETVLSVDGLPTGASFTVVVVGDDGSEYESGTFLGSDVTIDCRLNAAVLRQDVASVEIRAADGHDVAVATVPPVAS